MGSPELDQALLGWAQLRSAHLFSAWLGLGSAWLDTAGLAALGCTRLGLAPRIGWASMRAAETDPAELGSAGMARLSSAGTDSAELGSTGLGPAGLGSTGTGWARLG